ncbi:unnamed protein product [Symbiodinium necroappetens]|uniref:Endonuclease/exonuclease/phosphatase domain-containing protein n=1 Tax=Symbiodinium necroappetens TaxID=1628268 RepID=A0A812U9W2_9DINO|nr:unnamed protein product [Symbiodinium necroappetens]
MAVSWFLHFLILQTLCLMSSDVYNQPQGVGVSTTAAPGASILEAKRRAEQQGGTWYRGRWHSASSLGVTTVEGGSSTTPTVKPPPGNRTLQRLSVLSYNLGGVTPEVYDTFREWLHGSCQADIVLLQETHWGFGREDNQWLLDDWIAITSADSSSRFSGVAAFLRRSKFQEDAISRCTWIPGRLLHIRCQGHRAVLDIVVGYQWVWQEKDAHKVARKRATFWTKLGCLCQGLPTRHLLIMGADFNSTARPISGLVGRGLHPTTRAHDLDFEALLLEQKLVLLNTWTSATPRLSRTFLHGTQSSQIDFVLTRRRHADLEAKTAHPTTLDLVPWRLGPKHRMAGEEQMEVDQRAAVARNEVDLVFGRPLAAAEKEKETEEDRPPKWPKQEGGGKGFQQSNWSGWGGNRQKRQWEPAQPTGTSCPDKATQELLQVATRLLLRHENELARLRADTSFVLFIDTGSHSCLQLLKDAGAKWSELYSQGQVTMPLRAMLMMGLVQELKRALEGVRVDEDKYTRCKEAGWARDGAMALNPHWVFHGWDSKAKKQIVLEKEPLSNSEILRMLDTMEMESHVHKEGVLQCFKSAKPYEELESAEVAPFVLTISLRTQAADELHDIFTRLSGNACCKLLGFRVRPERGACQPLAKLLEQKFQETEYCDWKKTTSWRARSSA